MNETDKQLAEILKKGLETAEKTGNFIVEQSPDLIKQLLIWKTVEYSIYVIMGISLIIYFYRWTKKVAKEIKEKEGYFGDYFLGSFANFLITIGQISVLIIGIILIAENLHSLIQIVFAPKIYLIEYTAQHLGM